MNINIKKELSSEFILMLSLLKYEIIENSDNSNAIISKLEELKDNINWDNFYNLIAFHRVYPVIYRIVNSLKLDIPKPFVEKLQKLYTKNRLTSLNQVAEITCIAKSFENEHIKVIFIKSPKLSEQIYGDISLRPSKDIDVFIDKSDLKKAIALLENSGYVSLYGIKEQMLEKEEKALLKNCHIVFHNSAKNVIVELHWKITLDCNKNWVMPFEDMFAESKATNIAGTPFRIMSTDAQFVFLVYHGGKHAWFRLRWLLDIIKLLQKTDGINWKIISDKIQKKQLSLFLGQALILANSLFDLGNDFLPSEFNEILPLIYNKHSKRLAIVAKSHIKYKNKDYGTIRTSFFNNSYDFEIMPTKFAKFLFILDYTKRIVLRFFKEIFSRLSKRE